MKTLKLSLLAGLFFLGITSKLSAQSTGCSPTPTALPVNASCVNTAFSNNDNGTTQTVNASCATGTAYEDVWYSVTGTGNSMTITLSGSNTASTLAAFTGCGTGQVACNNVAAGATGSITFATTLGTTYFIQIQRRSGTSSTNQSGNICAVSAPPATGGDEPCTATPISVGASCSYGNYSNAGATASATPAAPGCANYAGGDVWFTVTVPASGNVTFDSNTGVITDGGMAIYSGASCSALTQITCDDDSSPNGLMPMITVTGQTPGATLWVRFWEYGNDNNGTFQLCAYEPVVAPPPANDNCGGAINVPVSTTSCSYVSGTIEGATASSQANGCSGTADDDVWFSFVATASAVNISLTNITNGTTDLYHNVYAGSCGAPGTALVCSDPNTSTVTGLTIGQTYFVRVFSWTSTFGQTSDFDICILATGPCGTPNNQDYCVAPATLTPGSGSFSSNTSGTYTADIPANLGSIFCGSIENNSWYQFVATSTTANFNITSVTGCVSGIQAQVYQVTEDVNGCCTNFASVSNCYNPANLTLGTVSATGLIPGQTYVLMVDGNGGSICDFTIANWTAVGILPVEIAAFTATAKSDYNEINWITATERNCDHFNVMRSFDGVHFEQIAQVSGQGYSNDEVYYSVNDTYAGNLTVYYQLEQVDYNGDVHNSEIVSINRASEISGITSLFPNPTSAQLTVGLNRTKGTEVVSIVDAKGMLIGKQTVSAAGVDHLIFDLSGVASGVYFVRYTDVNGTITTYKITKQ